LVWIWWIGQGIFILYVVSVVKMMVINIDIGAHDIITQGFVGTIKDKQLWKAYTPA
jgi:hypothetical protein